MGKLKALAYTGLAVILAGLVSFSCAKKQEMSKLNYYTSSAYFEYCLNKRDLQRDSTSQSKLRSEKNYEKSLTPAYNSFRTAYLKDLQGFSDSTEIYFNKMAKDIRNNKDNQELRDASSLMLLLGPGYYYFERGNYANAEKFLDLAESKLTENTPKKYLRSLFECLGDCKRHLGKDSDAECLYSLAFKNLKHENLTKGARKRVEERLKGFLADK